MKTRLAAIVAITITVALCAAGPAGAACGYTATDLGFIGGDLTEFMSSAQAINEAGHVVGVSVTPSGARHAFVWNGTGPMVDLGAFGGLRSNAIDINESGAIVGSYTTLAGHVRAILWQGGGAFDLGTLGGNFSIANAINDWGEIVGSSSAADGTFRAMYSTGGPTPFPALATLGGTFTTAGDINNAGVIVGSSRAVDETTRAVRWQTYAAPPADLGTLGGAFATASAMNEAGTIVGGSTTQLGTLLPFQYQAVPPLTSLGLLPRATSGQARAVNSHGQIVGNAGFCCGGSGAFLHSAGELRDLTALARPALDAAGIRILETATGINDRGQIVGTAIVNSATFFDVRHAYRLTPNTSAGTDVVVVPETATGTTGVTLTFDHVTAPGPTSLTIGSSGPPAPAGFAVGAPATYYEIETLASFSGSIEVCIDATGIDFGGAAPKLFHHEGGAWTDVTTRVEGAIVCGSVTSLSPFALFAPDAPRYAICNLYDPSRAVRSGATIPIKIQLCDSGGTNLSSPATPLHGRGVKLVSTEAPGTLEDSGNANPDGDFRYDAALAGYVYNLSTRGLATGTYVLEFTAGSDPWVYGAGFQVR